MLVDGYDDGHVASWRAKNGDSGFLLASKLQILQTRGRNENRRLRIFLFLIFSQIGIYFSSFTRAVRLKLFSNKAGAVGPLIYNVERRHSLQVKEERFFHKKRQEPLIFPLLAFFTENGSASVNKIDTAGHFRRKRTRIAM